VAANLIKISKHVDLSIKLFAIIADDGKVHVGTEVELATHLQGLVGSSDFSIAMQAAEILRNESSLRTTLGKTAKLIKAREGSRAAHAFAKSAALSVAWDHVQSAPISNDIKDKILASLHLAKFTGSDSQLLIDLSSIDGEICSLIDVQAIQQEINISVVDPIRKSSDNDNVEGTTFDIISEVPKLMSYLNSRLGPDQRISNNSYAGLLTTAGIIGVHGVDEIDEATRDYDDKNVSKAATGARQGQTSRVELMLLAAMGDEFIKRNNYEGRPWLESYHRKILDRLKKEGVTTGIYKPRHPVNLRFGWKKVRARPAEMASLFDDLPISTR
jgi:hypothetical protein